MSVSSSDWSNAAYQKHLDMLWKPIKKQSALLSYLNKRTTEGEGGCKLWTGYRQPLTGYGQSSCDNKNMSAHVLAYRFYHDNELPRIDSQGRRLVIRHICNNRRCIAEDHLVLGTCKENSADMMEAGTLRRGEAHYSSKITDETALKVINSKYPRGHSNYKRAKDRAKEFDVSLHIVYHLDSVKRRNWPHIPRETVTHPKKRKRVTTNTQRSNSATISEDVAKQIIASKKHKYDPTYRTQEERARYFEVSLPIIQGLDRNDTWQYLSRPETVIFSKPEIIWNKKNLEYAFEQVKRHCVYSQQNNRFVGTSCFEWQGSLVYRRPHIKVLGKYQPAYVFACEYGTGMTKPTGLITRHLCNNSICCEPTHLKFGTHLENANDMVIHASSKGFKLCPNDVLTIRQLYRDKQKTRQELREMYKVKATCIREIVNGLTWKYLLEPGESQQESKGEVEGST